MSTYIIQKNNVITLNRGDSLSLPIKLYTNNSFPREDKLILEDGDLIFFALMEPNQKFECSVIKKEYDQSDFDSEGNLVLQLDPLDTMGLHSGVYYYELKLLKHSDDSITTLIPKTQFIIVD